MSIYPCLGGFIVATKGFRYDSFLTTYSRVLCFPLPRGAVVHIEIGTDRGPRQIRVGYEDFRIHVESELSSRLSGLMSVL